MSAGSFYGQVCYPTQLEALQAACSALGAVAADGSSTTCTGVAAGPSSSVGGAYTGTLNLRKTSILGTTSTTTMSYTVQTCERYDYAYWSPVISAWVVALVSILAARTLYTRVFTRETL
jgi:hypothetical protein